MSIRLIYRTTFILIMLQEAIAQLQEVDMIIYSQAMTITNKFLKNRRFDNRVSSSVKMFKLLIYHRHFNVHNKVTLSFEKHLFRTFYTFFRN